jgi:hypothetical protein
MSTPENIRNKAYSAARQLVRNRLAESAGAAYEKLGPTEKMNIDRAVEKKQAQIKKIALKLIPQIANNDKKRLDSFNTGSPLANYGSPEMGDVNEELNKKFAKQVSSNKKEKPTEKGGKCAYIQMHNTFGEEVSLNSAVYKAMIKKSDKSGIDVNILGEVYNRGMNIWNENTNVSQQQYAFARVNSFINKGKTYFNEDSDLVTETKKKMKVEIQEETETFKKGDVVYLKTNKSANSPHTGIVKTVTPTHVHIKAVGGTGLYRAPHSSVTKDRKLSYHHVTYGNKNEETEIEEAQAKPYVKPLHNESGKQVGWKSSNGHHVKYWQMFAKKSALKHAKLEESIEEDDFLELNDEGINFFIENGLEFDLAEATIRNTKKLIQRLHDVEQGQTYGGQPYSSHPKSVMRLGIKVFGGKRFDQNARKAALLHDTIEDTPTTPETLIKKGFHPDVVKAVQLLSKDKTKSYEGNIENIASGNTPAHKIAQMVKYSDNMSNYMSMPKPEWDNEKVKKQKTKYMDSMKRLGQVLGVNHHETLEPKWKLKESTIDDNKPCQSKDINEDLRKWFDQKWVRIDTKGKIKGDCAREEGEGKPKCLPMAQAQAMDPKDRAKAARRKRREDPVADREGKGEKPINVRTEAVSRAQQAAIAISMKKAGRKPKNEEVQPLEEKSNPTNPALWSKAKSLARQKFDVYPSAYANGWAAKWYKSKGGGWNSANEEFVDTSKGLNESFNMAFDYQGKPVIAPTAHELMMKTQGGFAHHNDVQDVMNVKSIKEEIEKIFQSTILEEDDDKLAISMNSLINMVNEAFTTIDRIKSANIERDAWSQAQILKLERYIESVAAYINNIDETVRSGETHGVIVPAHTIVSQKTGQSITIPAKTKNVKKNDVVLHPNDNPFDGK